ncbi:MAG: FAD-binding protein [Treponema sp.]|nr:FAD-binding protein [Candidatus Treponema caballi]
MKYSVTLTVPEGDDTSEAALRKLAVQEIAKKAKRITEKDISAFIFKKKSLDARRNAIKTVFRYDVYTDGDKPDEADRALRPWLQAGKQDARQVVIIGDGPAGIFAALRLLEDGIKPVIIERGPEAAQRKRDIADISRTGSVHADSNYCFGEGGAGTFSDGKLFSRSNKRGNIDKILQIFAFHGAQASITTDAHPHIGTDRLPAIIGAMNETIRSHGGEVHFNTRCEKLIMEENRVTGVSCIDTLTGSRSEYRGKAVILATGHSAPDIYEMLAAANPAALEAKTFAAGVRVEHPREKIDRIQYHGRERGGDLPAAEYRLTTQVDGRGVYSFCMCPGGLVVPSASAPGGVVVNGMSPSSRNARWSNAAIVVELRPEDYGATDALAGLHFRTQLEQAAYNACHDGAEAFESSTVNKASERIEGTGGVNPQAAPAQRLVDFLEGRLSSSLPESSYTPGLVSARLDLVLPEHISRRLKQAFRDFDRNMHGFICEEALLIAPETRTSTPVRILRDKETRESPVLKGLYPAGEGSGYAGGITSSAMDGESTAALVSGLV